MAEDLYKVQESVMFKSVLQKKQLWHVVLGFDEAMWLFMETDQHLC